LGSRDIANDSDISSYLTREVRPCGCVRDIGVASKATHQATYQEKPESHGGGSDNKRWSTTPAIDELIGQMEILENSL
jgi:hypothetical protein